MKTHISRSVFFLLLLLFVLPLSDVLPSTYVFVKYPFTFLLAFGLALWATPLARNAALRYNIVDNPDGRLKDHSTPTPYLGGIVVYIAFLLTLSCTFGFTTRVLGITLAGAVLVIVGLFDDMRAVTPGVKFLGQLIAILVLIKSGIRIELISLPNWISLPLTVLWVAGVINAINIIDIMDGLATGVAFCASMTLFAVSLLNGQTMIGIMTVALAGSLLGLLRYNFEPAQIYLGDTGSMFIGLMLGALAMIGEYTEQSSLGVVAPILILGVPIFDMLFVMVLRYRKGISMFLGSKDHYALRCRKIGFSVKQIALMSYAATMVFGGCALLIMQSSFTVSFIVLTTVFAGIGVVAYRLARIEMPSNTQIFQSETEEKNI